MLLAALPTTQFVVGLREGVEAALIVGIIATFLRQQGRKDALPAMWAGVGIAVAICTAVAVVLQLVNESLPQKQQEGFEAIIGAVAVAMVTFMIVFMKRHARDLGGQLRSGAGSALAQGSAIGLVAMAFLAVMREGLETAVFLLATFQSSFGVSPVSAGIGTVAGLLVAAAIGWGIYRAGMKVNLARFFKVTGVLLIVIAAGLVAGVLKHADEAGIFRQGNLPWLDLSAVITPDTGSIVNGLSVGLFGIESRMSYAQTIGWLAYAIPMFVFLFWPQRSRPRTAVASDAAAGDAAPGAPAAAAPSGSAAAPAGSTATAAVPAPGVPADGRPA